MFINPVPKTFLLFVALVLNCPAISQAESVGSVHEILARYIKAQGGLLVLEEVKSVRVEGVVERESETFHIMQIKKLPNLVRTKVNLDRGSLSTGYNGEIAWLKPSWMAKSIPMEPVQADAYISNAPLFSQLYRLRNYPENITITGNTVIDGRRAIELQLETLDGKQITLYLDAHTYYELKSEIITDSDQGVFRTETYFHDIQRVAPLYVPFRIETFVNGKLESTIRIESVTINPGVFDTYFDPPGGLEQRPNAAQQSQVSKQAPRETAAKLNVLEDDETHILGDEAIHFLPDDATSPVSEAGSTPSK